MKIVARAYRPKLKKGEMNNTERAYAEHLAKLKLAGEIEDFSFESETLKIGPDCRYTPDFRVLSYSTEPPSQCYTHIEFHEVKGSRIVKTKSGHSVSKAYTEDDALVKIKAASEMHPYKFIIVWKGQNGQWEKREIN